MNIPGHECRGRIERDWYVLVDTDGDEIGRLKMPCTIHEAARFLDGRNVGIEVDRKLHGARIAELEKALTIASTYLPHGINYWGPRELTEESVRHYHLVERALRKRS